MNIKKIILLILALTSLYTNAFDINGEINSVKRKDKAPEENKNGPYPSLNQFKEAIINGDLYSCIEKVDCTKEQAKTASKKIRKSIDYIVWKEFYGLPPKSKKSYMCDHPYALGSVLALKQFRIDGRKEKLKDFKFFHGSLAKNCKNDKVITSYESFLEWYNSILDESVNNQIKIRDEKARLAEIRSEKIKINRERELNKANSERKVKEARQQAQIDAMKQADMQLRQNYKECLDSPKYKQYSAVNEVIDGRLLIARGLEIKTRENEIAARSGVSNMRNLREAAQLMIAGETMTKNAFEKYKASGGTETLYSQLSRLDNPCENIY